LFIHGKPAGDAIALGQDAMLGGSGKSPQILSFVPEVVKGD
jgi:hypothetical protein